MASVPNSISAALSDAHMTANRMETRLDQLLSDLTGSTNAVGSAAPGAPGALAERSADLVARLNSIACMIERVQELVTGNPAMLQQGLAGGSGVMGSPLQQYANAAQAGSAFHNLYTAATLLNRET